MDSTEHCNKQKNDGLIDSSSYIICGRKEFDKRSKRQLDLVRSNILDGDVDVSEAEIELLNGQACPMLPVKKNLAAAPVEHQNTNPNPFRTYLEPYSSSKVGKEPSNQ